MVSLATALPLCRSRCNQVTAREVLPTPAGPLTTARRFSESREVASTSRGRSISPGQRGGTILVAKNCCCIPPSIERLPGGGPLTERIECGSTNAHPLRSIARSPHWGIEPECQDYTT